MTNPFHPQENLRLENLAHYQVLDARDEEAFQDIANDIQFFLKAPTVLVSFMDLTHQRMVACIGNSGEDVPRENTFCQYTVLSTETVAVEDATQHPIFHSFPAVVGGAHVRAYLGTPIISPEGFPIGTLCLIDQVPRHFTEADHEAMRRFAKRTMNEVQQRLLRKQYQQVTEDLQALMQASPNGVVVLDAQGCILGCNPAAEQITGMSLKAGQTLTLEDFNVDEEVSVLEPIYSTGHPATWFTMQEVSLPHGRTLWMLEDITDHIQNQQYFQHMAFQDPLTGLPNRRAFEEDLRTELSRMERHSQPLGVVMIDLDGLKTINDQQGHDSGDRLLQRFAVLLQDHLREADRCYRLGGDEYAALLPCSNPEQQGEILKRLEALGEILEQEGFAGTGVSVGVAHGPLEADTAEHLVRLADTRMYHMKEQHHQS